MDKIESFFFFLKKAGKWTMNYGKMILSNSGLIESKT